MGAENGATRMLPIVEPLSDVGGREAAFIGAILGETEPEVPEFRKGRSPPEKGAAQVELGRCSVRGPSRLWLIRVSLAVSVSVSVLIACRTEARL